MLEQRIIKKYQNRRLYDTATSMYIVLEDIREIIIKGEKVKVIDVKTNQDVTRSVLLQIMLEEEANGVPMFSDDFLFQIIRFYGKTIQSSVGPFLEHGVDLFLRMQKQFYTQVRQHYGEDDLASAPVEFWKNFFSNQSTQMEQNVKEYIENSTNNFIKMQERFQKHTENMLNYMQFPFNKKKG